MTKVISQTRQIRSAIIVLVALFGLCVRMSFADGVCSGLSGSAFGLCDAYCKAQQCNLKPDQQSCTVLRSNFQKLTGTAVFPCDVFCGDGSVNQPSEQCDPPGSPTCHDSLLCKKDCTCPTTPTQSCEETQPSREQIQAAVLAALVGLVNPWQNAREFDLLLSRTEAELGCVLRAKGTASAPQSVLPQVIQQGCAAAGVQYCGPGNSQAGTVLSTVACLNEACCQHDRCYAADCVASECVWTPQSQTCDEAPESVIATCNGLGSCGVLDLLHPSAVFICTVAECLNTSPPFNTGSCVDLKEARLLLNPQCHNAATCQCTGQTCATFTTCNPGSACSDPVCASTAEGGGVCVEGTTPCAGLSDCTSSADCGGGICFVNTCCGRSVCGPTNIFCPDVGVSQSLRVTLPASGATIGRIK